MAETTPTLAQVIFHLHKAPGVWVESVPVREVFHGQTLWNGVVEVFTVDHLVVTSTPYWNLKRYNDSEGQLGHVENYEQFLTEWHRVWTGVYRILVPGGRMVCVVGDEHDPEGQI